MMTYLRYKSWQLRQNSKAIILPKTSMFAAFVMFAWSIAIWRIDYALLCAIWFFVSWMLVDYSSGEHMHWQRDELKKRAIEQTQ